MPLSDHEQRLLDQIEQALYAEDPKFAANVRSVRKRPVTRRWIPISIVGVVLGLGIVLVGLMAKQVAVGVGGFVVILAAVAYATRMISVRKSAAGTAGPSQSVADKSRSGGIRSRMEDRLRRRFDEN